jgi:hypothetical protein
MGYSLFQRNGLIFPGKRFSTSVFETANIYEGMLFLNVLFFILNHFNSDFQKMHCHCFTFATWNVIVWYCLVFCVAHHYDEIISVCGSCLWYFLWLYKYFCLCVWCKLLVEWFNREKVISSCTNVVFYQTFLPAFGRKYCCDEMFAVWEASHVRLLFLAHS